MINAHDSEFHEQHAFTRGRRGVGTSMAPNPLDKIAGPYMRRALAGAGART